MKTRITLATVLALGIAAGLGAQQVRDTGAPGAPPRIGTGVISGAVMTDEQTPQPVRRAAVSVVNTDGSVARTTFTDAAGRFTLSTLPEGRYTLTATKAPFLRTNYGAKRFDLPATPIILKDGGRMTDVALRLQRGGVLSGRITDENGEPAFGVSIRLLQIRTQFGERAYVPVSTSGTSTDTTDDRGAFRLFGLPPGEYVVSASPRTAAGEIRAMTEQEIRDIMQALQQQQQQQQAAAQGAQATSMPGQNPAPPAQPAPSDLDKVTVAFTPVFYPGTTVAASAAPVTLGPGEERTGVDFALRLVRTSTIEGTISVPQGIAPQSVQLLMVPNTSGSNGSNVTVDMISMQRAVVGPDGRFKYTGIAPGQYTISAQATKSAGGVGPPPPPPPPPPPGAVAGQAATFTRVVMGGAGGGEMPLTVDTFMVGPGGSDPAGTPYWAQADVAIDGAPVSGVSLSLQPGLTITGRVEFKSANTRSADFKRVQLNLSPTGNANGLRIATSFPVAQIDETGKFTITGVVPGRYRLNGNAPVAAGSGPGAPWRVGSAIVKGRDVLDFPLDVAPGDELTDAVVTFTDATQSIGGSLQDASGRPAPDYTIVIFAADKTFWTQGSRRVRTARPGTDGKFTVSNLPPGDYRMAAVVDVAPSDINDPAFLEQIVGASFAIKLGVGENKTQDLKIAGGL
jgi:hypothetical protein